jgi:hypothetical protein
MSLIQDALKRKSEETPPPPAVPTPATSLKNETRAPQPILIILIVALILALLAALGGLAFALIRSSTPPRPPVTPDREPVVVEEPTVATAVDPVVEEPVEIPPPQPVIAPEPIALEERQSEPEPAVARRWPDLKLTGIAQADNRRLAILNGKMIPVGRMLGDVTVLEVTDQAVVVEYRDEQRTLYINE